jgi:DNA-binding transcriptional ArsR family regulator
MERRKIVIKSAATSKPKAKGQRGKRIEEIVSYSLGHRIRIEILALLNEGTYTPDEISEILGEPIGKVTHHIAELADGGAIELARTEPVRNATRHFYCAVRQPFVTDEEAAAMTPQERQILVGLILQSIMAESMSAFWAGNMIDDPPNTLLSWRWFNVDKQGRREIIVELAESWGRIQEIEARANARRLDTGEDAVSVLVALQGYRRSRSSLLPPATFVNPE